MHCSLSSPLPAHHISYQDPCSGSWQPPAVSALLLFLAQVSQPLQLWEGQYCNRATMFFFSLHRQCRYLSTQSRSTRCISMMMRGPKLRQTTSLTWLGVLICALWWFMIATITSSSRWVAGAKVLLATCCYSTCRACCTAKTKLPFIST